MNPLPIMGESLQGKSQDWGQAVANMDGARQVAESLRALVNDAVYLDEDSFSTASNVVQYQQRIQVRARTCDRLLCCNIFATLWCPGHPVDAWQFVPKQLVVRLTF